MELPGGDDEWLAPSPSPPGPAVPDRHDEHGVGTFIWPPVGTTTWPPMGTFSWPRTGDGASSLRRTLAGELTGTPELLVLGLSDIEQIDGDGIDALHSVAELADEDDIRLCLVVLPKGAVRACLQVVELMKTFQTFSSVTEALQHPHD